MSVEIIGYKQFKYGTVAEKSNIFCVKGSQINEILLQFFIGVGF